MKLIRYRCFWDFGWELSLKLFHIKNFSLVDFRFSHSCFFDLRPNIYFNISLLSNKLIGFGFGSFNITVELSFFNFYSYDYD